MNKKQIEEKNIVLDLDKREFIVLSAAFGYAAEDVLEWEGRELRKVYYMAMMHKYREEFERFGARMTDMFIALHGRV